MQFAKDTQVLASAIRDSINFWSKKPFKCCIEVPDETQCIYIQSLGGTKVVKRYVDGSYIAQQSFAIYARIRAIDTGDRIDALAVLGELCDWLEVIENGEYQNVQPKVNDKTIRKVESVSVPTIAARYGDGTEDYQVQIRIEYERS